jgi:ankyrin repeat protein
MEITLESLNDDNYYIEYKCISYITSKGFTKLMKLVMLTNEYPELQQEIEQIINDNPEEINKQNHYGFTALILASGNSNMYSNIDTVKLLLNHPSINVNIQDNEGCSALMRVAKYCNTYSNIDTFKLLLKHTNIDINLQNKKGFTSLIFATDNNIRSNGEIIKLLLEHPNIDVNVKDYYGYTALMLISDYSNIVSNVEIIKTLLNHPKINLTNYLDFIIKNQKLHLIKLIPFHKIDKSLFDKYQYIYDLINNKITKQTFGYNMQNNIYSDIEICFQ